MFYNGVEKQYQNILNNFLKRKLKFTNHFDPQNKHVLPFFITFVYIFLIRSIQNGFYKSIMWRDVIFSVLNNNRT